MVLFDWDGLSEVFEEEFEGVIIDAKLPCDCALCEKGREKLSVLGRPRRTLTQLHIVIAPLDENRSLRHVFIDVGAQTKWSRRGVWALALKFLGITVNSIEDLLNKMANKIFVFKRTTVGEALSYYAVSIPTNLRRRDSLRNALEADIIFPVSMIAEGEYALKGIDANKLKEYIERRKKEWEGVKESAEEEEEVQFL